MNFQWTESNEADLLINGNQFFQSVFDCIRAAQEEILIETFIIFNDEVGQKLKEALLEAAARQVRIDITVDGYGTAGLDNAYITELTDAGIHMHVYDPKPRLFGMRTNLFRRLHRKIVVVDGTLAYISGINFGADHLPNKYAMGKQDYGLRVRGPIVKALRDAAGALLLEHQAVQELPPIRSSSSSTGDAAMLLAIRDNHHHRNDIEEQYLQAIRSAKSRLVIANAYFFPSYRLYHELRNAARRGVNVTLILQGRPDMPWARMLSISLYDYMLQSGIRIFEYTERPLHGKIAIVDYEWSTVGSSNLDPLSLSLNLEANLFVRDAGLNQRIQEHLSALIESSCKRITAESVEKGRWWRVPLMFVSFHFLRHFPKRMGWLPAHAARLKTLVPKSQNPKSQNPKSQNPKSQKTPRAEE